MDFGLTSLFERAAAASPLLPPPSRAPCESLRCRGFDGGRRCKKIIQYHDHVCHEHVDYYRNWWEKNIEKIFSDNLPVQKDHLAELDFQLGRGYVDFDDPYFKKTMSKMEADIPDDFTDDTLLQGFDYTWNSWSPYFIYFCRFQNFDASKWPAFLQMVFQIMIYADISSDYVNRKHIHKTYKNLLKTPYLQYRDLLKVHMQVLAKMYNKTVNIFPYIGITAKGPDYVRYVGDHLENLPQPFCCCAEEMLREFDHADDETKILLRAEMYYWSSCIKSSIHGRMNLLRAELMEITWAPKRLPFWTLDEAEIAETFSGGIRPTYEEWLAICEEADKKVSELYH